MRPASIAVWIFMPPCRIIRPRRWNRTAPLLACRRPRRYYQAILIFAAIVKEFDYCSGAIILLSAWRCSCRLRHYFARSFRPVSSRGVAFHTAGRSRAADDSPIRFARMANMCPAHTSAAKDNRTIIARIVNNRGDIMPMKHDWLRRLLPRLRSWNTTYINTADYQNDKGCFHDFLSSYARIFRSLCDARPFRRKWAYHFVIIKDAIAKQYK